MIQFTDTELRLAITNANNWVELMISLGYSNFAGGNTKQNIRNRAKAMGISLEHLKQTPGTKRTWSNQDLFEAIESSSSWKEVANKLRSSISTARKQAAKLDLDCSKFDKVNKLIEPVATPIPSFLESKLLRHSAENFAAYWYEMHGYEVFVPSSDQGTDLLVAKGVDFRRVQVKSSTSNRGIVHLSRRAVGSAREPYKASEVDEFFILDYKGNIFRIPFDAVDGQLTIVIKSRFEKYKVGIFQLQTLMDL